jgi:hypothetical protein
MSANEPIALSEQRLRDAIETLTAAFRLAVRGEITGARDVEDLDRVMVEAKRNLVALTLELHGNEAWERMQDA